MNDGITIRIQGIRAGKLACPIIAADAAKNR